MTTPAHIMAADNYYLLPSYDETLRYGGTNQIFGARAIIGGAGALKNGGPYILDKSIIILVEKVCGNFLWLKENAASIRASRT